jgi:deazaflavin-dependent oxidoreductase (nitroreductase family)
MSDTADTTKTDPSESPETGERAAANAWEEALIADLRANGGRPSGGPLAGDPLLLLYATGARSGQQRRAILTYSRDGEDYVVAGTASGAKVDPKWVANVRSKPAVTVEAEGETFPAVARIADGAERDRLWDQHVAQIPRFGDYPSQVGGRVIPMVRLTRTSG